MSINIIQKAFTSSNRKESVIRHDSSPVKTVLGKYLFGYIFHFFFIVTGSLNAPSPATDSSLNNRPNSEHTLSAKVPNSIEEVPFRRQDIRILVAKNRRMMDRKLILYLVISGLFLLFLGLGLILLYNTYEDQHHYIRPLIVIGPVLIGASLFTIMFSIEICLRLRVSLRRMQDRDIDNLSNPHEVKHWMDPKLIPYGWGLFDGIDTSDELDEQRLKLLEDPPRIMVISPSILHPLVE